GPVIQICIQKVRRTRSANTRRAANCYSRNRSCYQLPSYNTFPGRRYLNQRTETYRLPPEVELQIPQSNGLPCEFATSAHKLSEWYKESLALDKFWELWHTDYLAALRERHQLRMKQPKYTTAPPQANDVVIVADDKLPRSHWPLGLVIKVNPSADDRSRAATVRMTNSRILTRSLAHLYPLEIRANNAQDPNSTQARSSTMKPLPQRIQPKRAAKTLHKFIH
ncbi:hypothetical protein V3C99_001100, partial [Haemonchus contortus]